MVVDDIPDSGHNYIMQEEYSSQKPEYSFFVCQFNRMAERLKSFAALIRPSSVSLLKINAATLIFQYGLLIQLLIFNANFTFQYGTSSLCILSKLLTNYNIEDIKNKNH